MTHKTRLFCDRVILKVQLRSLDIIMSRHPVRISQKQSKEANTQNKKKLSIFIPQEQEHKTSGIERGDVADEASRKNYTGY